MAAVGRRGDGAVPRLGTCILHSGDKSLGDNREVSLHATLQLLPSWAPNTSAQSTCHCCTKASSDPPRAQPSGTCQCGAIHGWPGSTRTGGEGGSPLLPCAEVLLQLVPCLPPGSPRWLSRAHEDDGSGFCKLCSLVPSSRGCSSGAAFVAPSCSG